MTETLQGCLREMYPHYAPHNIGPIAEHIGAKFPTTFISIVFSFEIPGRLQGAYLMNLGAPSLPPEAPTTSATSQNILGAKFQTTFISIVLPSERPGRLQGAYLMYLGAPPLPPVAPTTSATSQNTSGPNSKQLLFRSSFPLSSLEGYRENILFSGGPPPPFAPLWGTGEGV